MATLKPYYMLCRLLDFKALLGVNPDCTNESVIVTLGRIITSRYRLSDQKELQSWTTHQQRKLTAPVVFDGTKNQYVGIINSLTICVWTETDTSLDKVKKYVFCTPLHTILPNNIEEPMVIFKNGNTAPLSKAIKYRKEPKLPILEESDNLEEFKLVTSGGCQYGVFLTTRGEETWIQVVFLTSEMASTVGKKKYKFPVVRDGRKIMGKVIMERSNACTLITLWSDNQLFSLDIIPSLIEDPPGILLDHVPNISTQHAVAMVALDPMHIVMYGAETNEEGAVAMLFNLQFRLIQSKHYFKLFNDPPNMWLVGNHIFLPVGQYLLTLPYHIEQAPLATMVGKHRHTVSGSQKKEPVMQLTWTFGSHTNKQDKEQKELNERLENMETKNNIDDKISEFKMILAGLEESGLTESMLCCHLFPQLREKNDIASLYMSLLHFQDIPELELVQTLQYCFQLEDSVYENAEFPAYSSKLNSRHISLGKHELPRDSDEISVYSPFPENKSRLINCILMSSYTSVFLLDQLWTLPFPLVLNLLQCLCQLLLKSNVIQDNPHLPGTGRIAEWVTLLIDAHYYQFLLSKDMNVYKLLLDLNEAVSEKYEIFEELDAVEPLLTLVKEKRGLPKHVPSKLYSIEILSI